MVIPLQPFNKPSMNSLRTNLLLTSLLVSTITWGQKLKKADKEIITSLRQHIGYLADDKLEGRRAGSAGEALAMEYISAQFRNAGLAPKGSNGFYQSFDISEGTMISPSSYFVINDDSLEAGREYFPLPYSAQMKLEALPSIAIQEPDMPWFVDLQEILLTNKDNPHFDLDEYIRKNAVKARDKGASAVIIYNTSDIDDKLAFNPKDKSAPLPLPVIYLAKGPAKKYFADETATLTLKLNVLFAEKKRQGHNVVGYLDNGASNTVIIGAHFDHLGYGDDGNSMLRTGEKLIHNGADDNASGTAAMIELSRILKNAKSKNNNYLFIAFSGEELGLYGSKYFTDHPTIDLAKVNYMINLDMVGRLRSDSVHALSVGGYGTSPAWASVIRREEKKRPFKISIDSSGSGPSDHTSFYRKDIPVLFFFTGQHTDYHRPSDDADKINYEGELSVIRYIEEIIMQLNKANQKLAFLKTREASVGMTSFKVTLGIMPDYTYTGNGVRADGVTDGRPASKAGMKTGDVIIQLGPHAVNSVETYMQALNKFSKGDRTKLKFKRGNETIESEVQF
ncbi:MAG: M28 family peptidase [Pedobacter sp.]|nr:MAG: M28 family peptidase [Pedobacter sp.]